MDKRKYQNYKEEDFLLDEVFRKWVLQPNEELNIFWRSWLESNKTKGAVIKAARVLLLSMEETYGKNKLNRFEKVVISNEIQTAIGEEKKPRFSAEKNGRIKKIKKRSWYRSAVAIALTLFVLTIIGLLVFPEKEILYVTEYGETETILLPDSSLVTLNANSSLRLSKTWKEGTRREVWLSGEAFFEVQKMEQTQAKFVVHTEDLDVEVIGTQFNVRKRKDATKVVLQEGEIRLELHSDDQKEYLMEPGDMISYSAKKDEVKQTKVKPENYSSWKDQVLIFENVPLEEVATTVEENFGIGVVFKDVEKKKKKIQLTISSKDISILFESLETLYDIKINKEGNRIEIY